MVMETYDERVPERFWRKVEVRDSGCWEWMGARGGTMLHGYFGFGGKNRLAHRYLYKTLIGPIPDGLVCDHLCDNPPCVNPGHLQIVTQRENVLRSRRAPTAINYWKTRCKRGHPLDEGSFYRTKKGGRQCRACHVENSRDRRAAFDPEKRLAVLRRQRERMANLRRARRAVLSLPPG